MDQFGVLVESIGFKSQCKVPLANLKGKTSNNIINDGFPGDIGGINSGLRTTTGMNPSFDDGLDGIFKSNSDRKKTQNSSVSLNDFDDVFGEFISSDSNSKQRSTVSNGTMFDFDSVFNGGPFNLDSNSNVDNDDIFGAMPGFKTSGSSSVSTVGSSTNLGLNSTVDNDNIFGAIPGLKASGSSSVSTDDLFGSMVPPPSRSDSIDDLLGDFGGMKVNSNVPKSNSGKKDGIGSETDDLIPGFGGNSRSSNGAKRATIPPPKSSRTLTEDPFVMFERSNDNSDGVSGAPGFDNYLDSFFNQDTQTIRGGKTPKTEDSVFDTLFQKTEPPKKEQKQTSSGVSYTTKKPSSVTNSANDFSFLFEVEVGPSSSQFQEIKGESEERRKARLNHHMRTQQRMAKVLNEKTQRDLQTQREQEERHRLAETLDVDIKRWAAGKEGNLRALLSSLQQVSNCVVEVNTSLLSQQRAHGKSVLWPECGWQPVSLTDLITSNSVKKVYYKATLCVHPDKVQQKGATLEQKYIAEKVFDLLKEAWNKLNTEELKKR